MRKKLLFVVNVDWALLSHRIPIALAAKDAGYDVHIATGITDKRDDLEALGFMVHPLGLVRRGVSFLNAIRTVLQLQKIIKKVKPDVMHLVTIKPVLLGGLVARWMHVPALVSAVSGLGYVFTARGLRAKLRRFVVCRVYVWALGHRNQIVIFQNPDDRDTLIKSTGLPVAKVALIRGSGVDLEQFPATPLPLGSPVVLCPARLLADKGVFEFVAASRILRDKGIQVRFVLVGLVDEANPTSISQYQLDAWEKEGVVENWGYQRNMPSVFASSSIVVLPSYREGLPKALIEAASCGRAVVTTNVPGCRDAIDPGVTGLLVPLRDSAALAQAIEQLLTNVTQREAMGIAGRRLAEKEFNVHAVVNKHLEIYKSLLV